MATVCSIKDNHRYTSRVYDSIVSRYNEIYEITKDQGIFDEVDYDKISLKEFMISEYPKLMEIYLSKDFSNYRYTVNYRSDIIVIKYLINKIKKLNIFGHTNELIKLINKSIKIQKIMKKNIVKQKNRRKKIFL